MRSVVMVLGFVCACLPLAAPTDGATQLRHLGIEELGATATVVVRGQVSGVRGFWNEKRTKILTEITVDVVESYKGDVAGVVRLIQLGGVVDNVRVTADGALQWTQDEEVLLFLEPYGPGTLQVTGFSQGKFLVERDPATGDEFVRRPAQEGVTFTGAPAGRDAAAALAKVPLSRFVRQALAQPEATER